MKRSNRIYLLLGVLVVVCIAAFAVIRHEEHKEKIKNSDEIILEIPSDSVKSLSWEHKSNTLSFHKDEKWLYNEDEAFPVDENKINDLLERFQEFGVSFIIEDVEDYGQYGLDDPVCTIKLSTEDKSYEIKLGDFSTMDSERYVSIGDGNVYLVKNDPLDKFDAVLSDLIDNDETPDLDKATEIQFEGNETYNIVYEEDNTANTCCADDVYFAQINGKKRPLATSRVNNYLRNVSNLDLTDYVTYKASDDELKTYGLDTPELKVTIYYTSEDDNKEKKTDTFVLNVSRDPKEKKAEEESAKTESKDKDDEDSSEEKEITAYARVGESPIVYKITSVDYTNLMAASYDSLRHLDVLTADFKDINQIDISLDGSDYTITTKKKGDEITYYYQDEELEIDTFRDALVNLKADSFTDEQPAKKKEIGLTVHLDNKNFPEVRIDLYRYDGSHCLAVIDNEPVSLVKRSYAVDLIEAVYAFVLN